MCPLTLSKITKYNICCQEGKRMHKHKKQAALILLISHNVFFLDMYVFSPYSISMSETAVLPRPIDTSASSLQENGIGSTPIESGQRENPAPVVPENKESTEHD